ncbi:MFS transporter [Streptomyces carpaticus]|uniref:MFS transporter n=1 Tax=Streptomyces carpaticus TaxID=285558 RepID=UPI0031F9457E
MSEPVPTTDRTRWVAFAVLCSMQLMIVVDISIVTVALRSIQEDLGIDQARLAWVTNAYTLGFGGVLLLSGRLGDLVGRKRMFLIGLTTFTAASAFAGLAWNQEVLIAMRFIQGTGAGMAFAVVMGIIVTLFTDPRERGMAMGASGFAQAAGASFGIIAGGVLSHGISWHWVFYVNVPIGVVALYLAARLVPDDRGPGLGAGADVIGAALVTSALLLGVYTIATVPDYGWSSGHTLGFGGAAVALFIGFLIREATAAVPLVRLGVFRNRNLAGGNIVHLLFTASTVPFNILIALYLQQVVGHSPLSTAFAFLPLAVVSAICSLALFARLNMRYGPRTVLIGGLLLVVAGLALAARVPVDPVYVVDFLPVALLVGVGGGLVMPAVMMISMSVRSPDEVGLASGVAGTSGMIGDTLGIAALAAIATAHTNALIADGGEPVNALNDGFQLAFLITAGVTVLGLAVAVLVLRPQPAPPAGPPGPPPTGEEEHAAAGNRPAAHS